MYKVLSCFFIAPLFFSGLLNAQAIELDKLIEIAIKNNSNIKISKFQKQSKTSSLNIAKAQYYPTVALVGELSKHDIDSTTSNMNGEVVGAVVSANQLVYDFGQTANSINAAKEDLASSDEEIATSISSTILQTKQAYYSILREQQRVTLYREMIKIDALHLEQVQEYHKAGIRTLIDVTDAKLQLSNSKLQLLDAQYRLTESLTSLNVVIGVENSQEYEIEKDPNIIELARSLQRLDTKIKTLELEGLKNRPELKLYKKQIDAQKYKLKSTYLEYYPSLELDASYSDKDSEKLSSYDARQMSAGLYLKWNLFTGNTTESNIKNAYASLGILQQQLFQKKLEIKKEISNAFSKVKSREESIEISFLAVTLASQKLDLANQRYKAGISDAVELNDATLEYSEAKSSLIHSYYDYLDSKAELIFAVGRMQIKNNKKG